MMTFEGMRCSLEAIVGSEHVWTAAATTAAYTLGGLRPRLVVQPATVTEAAAVVALAGRERLALVPWGQGTQMHLGQNPERYDMALSLTRLTRILDYDHANLTLTAESGLPLEAVYACTVPQRQFLPLGHPGTAASLGGLLVTNTSGVKRLRYGSVRDLVLGVRVALPDGAVAHFGGRVVKNVAGYDMNKLFIGSLGVFGVIVEVTYRLATLPEEDRLLAVTFPSLTQAMAAVHTIRASSILPSALLLAHADVAMAWSSRLPVAAQSSQVVLLLNCDGLSAAVERQMREARVACERAGGVAAGVLIGEAVHAVWVSQETWCHTAVPAVPPLLQIRLGVLPGCLQVLLEQLAQTPAFCSQPIAWLADASQGQIWARIPLPLAPVETCIPAVQHWLGTLREGLRTQQGYVVIESAPMALRPHLDCWGTPGGASLLALYKQHFDPHAVLNPGRYVTGL